MLPTLAEKAKTYLNYLCLEIPNRRVGSAGNQQATSMLAEHLRLAGFETICPEFACMDWVQEGATLQVEDRAFPVQPSPYSLGCQVEGLLAVVSTMEELEAFSDGDSILLVRGELAQSQLMPKNFPFYNPEEHQAIIRLLEEKAPPALITAPSPDPDLAGGLYPFALIEDGDFDIPSVYMTAEAGADLAEYAGQMATLESKAKRIPSQGCNVIARKGNPERRIIICAHIDAKMDTPGAIDNGSGVVILMLLAELLADHRGDLGLELLAFNGEDYYAASGEIDYLKRYGDQLAGISLVINIDAAGYKAGPTAYSLYGCPPDLDQIIRKIFDQEKSLVEGEPWYQSDHSVFIQQGIPAMAITSEAFTYLSSEITHTPKDRPEIVDERKLAEIALVLRDLVLALEARPI